MVCEGVPTQCDCVILSHLLRYTVYVLSRLVNLFLESLQWQLFTCRLLAWRGKKTSHY